VNRPAQIGRYRILGEVGRGAMGTVYRGRDASLERDVAIKVMSVGVTDPDARKRFLREGKAVGRLQHPNIVTIYELGEHEGNPFMALELLDGMDLQQAIEAGIRPDPKITLPIILQALAGLGHAHENGIVHRDVKPSNIFLPQGRPAKIMDFGVVRLAGGSTTKDVIVGTPNYMSPEQAKGGELDGRSDLFSVGLILYELVTGEKAYGGDSVVAVLFKITNEEPDLSLIPRGPGWDRVRGVLTRALQKKPEDRHPDARAMSADLQQALKELGGTADWMTPSDQGLLVRKRPAGSGGLPTPPPPVIASEALEETRTTKRAVPSRVPLALAGGLGGLAVVLLASAVFLFMRNGPASTAPSAASPISPATPQAARPEPSPSASAVGAAPTQKTAPSASAAPPSSTLVAAASPAPAPSPASSPSGPAGSPSTAAAVSPADARLDRASEAFEKGHYAQALAEAKAVLLREPDNAAAKELAQDAEAAILIEDVVKKARAALKAGDRETALAEIRRGLAVNPNEGRLMALFREATQ
jgi:serine/threonine-protein kinase